MRFLVENYTTGEVKVFVDGEENEMITFMRKAVLDFLGDSGTHYIDLPNNQTLVLDEESPEPLWWLGAAILYMDSVESGDWGDILTVEKIGEED